MLIRQLGRFAGVGFAAMLVHVAVAIAVEAAFGIPGQAANLSGFVAAVGVSYFGHLHLTFGVTPHHAVHGTRFVATALAGLAASSTTTFVVHDLFGAPFAMAMLAVAVVVPAVSFILMRFWVFIDPTPGALPDPRAQGRPDATARAALAFLVVGLLTAGPVLLHPYLPLVDLPNHIARLHIISYFQGPLDAYYDYSFRLVANSAVDLVWGLVGQGHDPVRFTQATMAFACLGFVGATMYLSRVVHGRWSVWPAAAGLVCYNANFFWGFQNFVVSVPFAIAGFALVLQSERHPLVWRLALLVPLAAALYVMHLFAFAALAIATAGRETQRVLEAREDRGRAAFRAAVLGLPFAGPAVAFAYQTFFGAPPVLGTITLFGSLSQRAEVFTSLATGADRMLPTSQVAMGIVVLCLLGFFLLSLWRNTIGRLVFHPALVGPVVALGLVALFTPQILNGVAFLHVRFPIFIAALFFAGTQWENLSPRKATLLAMAVLAVITARGVAFERYAARHSAETRDLIAVLDGIEPGSRLLPVLDDTFAVDRRLWHLAAYAVSQRDVFVPTVFRGTHSLSVRPEWTDHTTPSLYPPGAAWLIAWQSEYPWQLKFIEDWQRKYTHLLMLDPDTSGLDRYPALEALGSRGRFTLYRIHGPEGGS